MTENKMKFEKFYLIDYRGTNNRIVLKFVHVDNGKEIKGNTCFITKILQTGEIQMQTKFATKKFTSRYAKHKFRNLRQIQPGNSINIYHIPVILSEDNNQYIMQFYKPPKDK
jgi:hypothetical protein